MYTCSTLFILILFSDSRYGGHSKFCELFPRTCKGLFHLLYWQESPVVLHGWLLEFVLFGAPKAPLYCFQF